MKRSLVILGVVGLALAITSGAFAAKKYLITSSSQIKPGTISYANLSKDAQLKLAATPGVNGSNGAQGPQGPAGAKGDTGAQGAAGAKGDAGLQGAAGAKGDAGLQGAAGAKGDTGAQGPKGDTGPQGKPGTTLGVWSGFKFNDKPDTGCGGADVWAKDDFTRSFSVTPTSDGSGYLVTRYDLDGSYTTTDGAQDPGCSGDTLTAGQHGSFNGVWTMKVVMDSETDYNPEAQPTDGSWNGFLTSVFGVDSSHATTVSYEFDYTNSDHDHWRDSYYAGSFYSTGHILNHA